MMANLWTCANCHVLNPSHATACEACGRDREAAAQPSKGKTPAICPADGARLQADGWCPQGNGYLAHMACPFACPICRQLLSWDGGCEHCHGCTTGEREDWTFPGDRYELDAGHWQKILAGPRRACTREENAAGARTLAAILGAAVVPGRAAAEAARAE